MKIKRVIEIEETNCKLLESRDLTLDTTTMLKASKRDIESSVAVLDLIYALKESKPYDDSGDLISRSELMKAIGTIVEAEMPIDEKWALGLKYSLKVIDNAPTVEPFTQLEKEEIADAITYLLDAELLEENGYTEEVINALKSALKKVGGAE